MSPLPAQAGAAIGGRSFDLTARLTRAAGDCGVIFATGTENSGISMFVQDDRLVLDYNAFGSHTIVESDVPVPVGDSTVVARLVRGAGRAGSVTIEIDGEETGRAELALFMRMISSVGASVGYDQGSAVSDRYTGPFAFSGRLHDVVIELAAARVPGTADVDARAAMSRQ
jgi:arylsulfatase